MMSIRSAVVILVLYAAVIGESLSVSPTPTSTPSTTTELSPGPRYTDVTDGTVKFQKGTEKHGLNACYRCSSPCPSTTCCPGRFPQCCRVNGQCGCCSG